jgi:hypothetical protein
LGWKNGTQALGSGFVVIMVFRNIAFINHPVEYKEPMLEFCRALEVGGLKAFPVCILASDAQFLVRKLGMDRSRVLDVNEQFVSGAVDVATCRANLSELEKYGGPRILDIMHMDRHLRKKGTDFALQYLEHVHRVMVEFFKRNDIALVVSGIDSALQLMSMMVCRSLGIPWVVSTRLRIPVDEYGFCVDHEQRRFLSFRRVCLDDRLYAEKILAEFEERHVLPAALLTARNLSDVVRLLGPHFKVFCDLLRRAYFDRKNDYSRYPISEIVMMYLRRRYNMLRYSLSKPFRDLGEGRYCLYAMHRQPESSIDVAGSFFSDQFALIALIAKSLPVGYELYVKVHQDDIDGWPLEFYQKIGRIPGVRLIHYGHRSRGLVESAAVVFTLAGTIGLEAGLLGKPVITFSKSFYNTLPTVYYCECPPRLPGLIDQVLLSVDGSRSALRSRILDFLAHHRTCSFTGEFNRAYGERPSLLRDEDYATLRGAYDMLLHKYYNKASSDAIEPDACYGSIAGVIGTDIVRSKAGGECVELELLAG